MKTLASFVVVVLVILAGTCVGQWRKDVVARGSARAEALQARLDEMEKRYEGYWPRYERLEEALAVASNQVSRLTNDLAAERTANAPLRHQIETLSAERIAQASREGELVKSRDAAAAAAEQLKGNVEDVRSRQTQAEELRKRLEDRIRTLEEGLRSRDSDLAQMRERFDRQTAEFNRLQEANRAVTELQNQLANAKTERDEALAGREKARMERDAAAAERAAAIADRNRMEAQVKVLQGDPSHPNVPQSSPLR